MAKPRASANRRRVTVTTSDIAEQRELLHRRRAPILNGSRVRVGTSTNSVWGTVVEAVADGFGVGVFSIRYDDGRERVCSYGSPLIQEVE